ncbi:MAG: hypothetical protein IKL68_02185 [Clostridia bacterium]|nr:hypothetical protein [Clostridia bacterium]
MATGYEDIEKLTNDQSEMLDNALAQQQDIINKQTEQNVAELEKQKAEVDKEATKTNKGLYTEYKKASNPYGANAEQLYSRGLGNSGYAETSQTNLYNTYQKNVTETINSAQKLKADFDSEISRARQNGDIALAQNALEIYKQKMELLTQEYELRNNREQYLYQKEQDALAQSNWEKEWAYQQERDAVSDNQWQQSFDYNKSRDEVSDNQWQQSFDYQKNRDAVSDNQWQQSMDYQKQRDAVSDSQWAKEYALSKSNYENQLKAKEEDEAEEPKVNKNLEKVYKGVNLLVGGGAAPAEMDSARELIYGEVQNGRITEEEAAYLFEKFGL